jgi:hypothetical protein
MKFLLFISAVILLFPATIRAQELECDVTFTNLETLAADARDNLNDFIPQVKQYINTHRWTTEDFGDEKIRWTINISFLGATGFHYTAQAFIGSQRPIYKAGRITACLRIFDDKWEFDYIHNQSLIHSNTSFDPLLSFLDYYSFLVLGSDCDTYKTLSGTTYFQQASELVDKARGTSGAGKGWEVATNGSYSRAQMVEELLSPKFSDFRKAVHVYYYRGLDSLAIDPPKGMKKMLSALDKIGKFRDKINQPSVLIRSFFDTKYLEIAETFTHDPDKGVFAELEKIDPTHTQTYEEYSTKRPE